MSDTVDLCNQLGRMVRTADPVERRAFARELDRFWEQFPTFHERVVSGEAPGLFHFLIGALDAACREKVKTRPQLRVVRFPRKPAAVMAEAMAGARPDQAEEAARNTHV